MTHCILFADHTLYFAVDCVQATQLISRFMNNFDRPWRFSCNPGNKVFFIAFIDANTF
jgi:hypothetical protein